MRYNCRDSTIHNVLTSLTLAASQTFGTGFPSPGVLLNTEHEKTAFNLLALGNICGESKVTERALLPRQTDERALIIERISTEDPVTSSQRINLHFGWNVLSDLHQTTACEEESISHNGKQFKVAQEFSIVRQGILGQIEDYSLFDVGDPRTLPTATTVDRKEHPLGWNSAITSIIATLKPELQKYEDLITALYEDSGIKPRRL